MSLRTTRRRSDSSRVHVNDRQHITDPVNIRWYAHPDDVIGGWCIMPVDEPPSQGWWQIAGFISEETARHITELHNKWFEAGDIHPDQVLYWISDH